MKAIVPLLVILLVGCSSGAVKTTDDKLSRVHVDTIFLDYRFGMTVEEFNSHTLNLISDSVLLVENDVIYYPMHLEITGAVHARFSPEYANGKLMQLGVSFNPTNSVAHPELTALALKTLYMSKYGTDYTESDPIISGGTSSFTWHRGNLEVEVLQGFNDGRVFYRNLDAVKEKAAQDSIDRVNNISKARKSI